MIHSKEAAIVTGSNNLYFSPGMIITNIKPDNRRASYDKNLRRSVEETKLLKK